MKSGKKSWDESHPAVQEAIVRARGEFEVDLCSAQWAPQMKLVRSGVRWPVIAMELRSIFEDMPVESKRPDKVLERLIREDRLEAEARGEEWVEPTGNRLMDYQERAFRICEKRFGLPRAYRNALMMRLWGVQAGEAGATMGIEGLGNTRVMRGRPALAPPPGQLTVKDICDQLGVAKLTVYRWIDAGELIATSSPSGIKLVNASDFAAFVEARKQGRARKVIEVPAVGEHDELPVVEEKKAEPKPPARTFAKKVAEKAEKILEPEKKPAPVVGFVRPKCRACGNEIPAGRMICECQLPPEEKKDSELEPGEIANVDKSAYDKFRGIKVESDEEIVDDRNAQVAKILQTAQRVGSVFDVTPMTGGGRGDFADGATGGGGSKLMRMAQRDPNLEVDPNEERGEGRESGAQAGGGGSGAATPKLPPAYKGGGGLRGVR